MQYKTEQKCFIDNILYEAGDIIQSKKKLKASWLKSVKPVEPVEPVEKAEPAKKGAAKKESKGEGETVTL